MENIKYFLAEYMDEFKILSKQWEEKGNIFRFFDKDPTLWKNEEEHKNIISNRLGWLDAPEEMKQRISEIMGFVNDIRISRFKHAVILGMGGSSLCAEVLKKSFTIKKAHLSCYVLDSTDPETISNIERTIDLKHTLFIVASKSGTTIETLSHMRYFYKKISSISTHPGEHFCAITDQETALENNAQRLGFCKTFINPSDIGGRFSALSFFGLMPAALMGIDIKKMLDDATDLLEQTKNTGLQENPCFGPGLAIGLLATKGKNKLTLMTDPSIRHLGLWLEQLVAESTGKEGKGIVPIVDEPILNQYHDDRIFVYLQCGKAAPKNQGLVEALVKQGRPVIKIKTENIKNIGAEFLRWEIITSICSSVMQVNPFDEPNVKESKENTKRLLENPGSITKIYKQHLKTTSYINEFLKGLKALEYIAILFYGDPENYDFEKHIKKIRKKLAEKYSSSTVAGIGPRYLHSTGQILKGGPPDIRFIFITTKKRLDLDIPSAKYTFKDLQTAQAIGDIQAILQRQKRYIWIEISNKEELERFLEFI